MRVNQMSTLTGYLRVVNYDILECHFQITTFLFFNMETVVRQLKLILYYIIAPEEFNFEKKKCVNKLTHRNC